MTIREAYMASGLTMPEIAKCLRVPQRTLQDWIYGKRSPRSKEIPYAERILALGILTEQERAEFLLDPDWNLIIRHYRIVQAQKQSSIAEDAFRWSLKRTPQECIDILPTKTLTEVIDTIRGAYEEGRREIISERSNNMTYNTIILKRGAALLSNNEYRHFEKLDTICGIDAVPEELQRWSADQEAEARKALAQYECMYSSNGSVWQIEEYALEFCRTDEDGEFLEGSDYEPAETRMWYAVMTDRQDDDWSYGSHDLEEAKQMCRKAGPEAYIAIIDNTVLNAVCVGEIEQDDF